MKKTLLLTLTIILMSISLSGCWDLADIDKRLFVASFAIDKDDNNFVVTLTVPSNLTTGSTGSNQNQDAPVPSFREESSTIYGALDKLSLRINRMIDFSHTSVILIGEDTARDGLKPIQEFLERFASVNRRAQISISEGKAENIEKLHSKLEKQTSVYLDTIYENRNSLGYFVHQDVNDFIRMMHSTGGNMLMSKVKIGPNDAYIGGAAVIKDNKMVGWLDAEETLGINLIKNKIKNPLIPCDNITFEVSNSHAKLSVISSYVPTIGIDIKVRCNILEAVELSPTDEKKIKAAEGIISARIKSIVYKSLDTIQNEYGFDAIQLGEFLYKFYPDIWKKYQQDWNEIFPNVRFIVNVDATIQKVGSM